MTISIDSVKVALGKDFDPDGDYLVCGFNSKPDMDAKGYRLVGKIQDPSPEDREMLIYDRRPVVPPAKAKKGWLG